jgi:RNA polymerase sigma-70 factor (ECF subfamily)
MHEAGADDPFVVHRNLLFTVAYEMLGCAADAEDVLQETWLRWAGVDRSQVREPRAYLLRAVTRQCLNRLRTLARSREDYVGQWLPEPLLTGPGVAEDLELAESVSIAMLTVLETLAPIERAVFVLREVFDVPYAQIAEAVGKSAAAVRQIARRSREHVAARRPRMQVGRWERQAVTERFLTALDTGRLQDLLGVMARGVVLIADGGGIVSAVLEPVHGAAGVAPLLARARRVAGVLETAVVWLNGAPAGRIGFDGEPAAVGIGVRGGRVSRICVVRNPDRLRRLREPVSLARWRAVRAVRAARTGPVRTRQGHGCSCRGRPEMPSGRGRPFRSVMRWIFDPLLPRSVGFGPVKGPLLPPAG